MKRLFWIFSLLAAGIILLPSCKKVNVEPDESGTLPQNLTDTYDGVLAGVRLVISYDAQSESFVGTIENTTNNTVTRVRLEVHLSNGVELGPTTPSDYAPGEVRDITLPATGETFSTWTAHAESG